MLELAGSALAGLKNLHTLNLSWCEHLTDRFVKAIAVCQHLKELNLRGCKSEINVSAFADCASLHTLNLRCCRGVGVTDEVVVELAKSTILHTLDVRECKDVTPETVKELQIKNPKLNIRR